MKKNIFLFGVALVAMVSGCTDDRFESNVVNPVQQGDEILFSSTLAGDGETVGVKTVYGDRTETGIPVYWKEEGDLVAIFCPQASQPANKLVNYLVKPQTGTDGKPTNGSASVTAQVNPGEAGLQWGNADVHRFYAFYPAKSVLGTEDDGKIKSNIPVEQSVVEWRKESSIDNVTTHFGLPNMDFAYMYARDTVITAEVDQNEPINLTFHNLLTVLDITIPGPQTGTDPIVVTGVYVDAVSDTGQNNHTPFLVGDFYCYLRPGQGHEVGFCEPVDETPDEVNNRIAISTYDPDMKEFIKVYPGEQINVKAYILPHSAEVIETQSLQISVMTMNGAPLVKKLVKKQIQPGKINRVRLPYLEQSTETNSWISNIDPDVYFTELSLPGSHQSVGTEDEEADIFPVSYTYEKYQIASLEQQFRDGIRAFSFQTVYNTDRINVYASGKVKNELYTYLQELARVIDAVNSEKEGNREFALVSLTWKSDGSSGDINEWYSYLANELNNDGNYTSLPIYGSSKYPGELNANTTIGELAGKIVLRIDNPSNVDIPGLVSKCPSDRENSSASVGNVDFDMYWKNVNTTPVLRFYAHDATSIDSGGNTTGQVDNLATKLSLVKEVFSKSVDLYKNNTAHDYFFHTNIGGFYCIDRWVSLSNNSNGGQTIQYTKDIMPSVVDYIQTRGQDASMGVILMNFADKQAGSGADYGCDDLIQTIIFNNFSFALRKKTTGVSPAPIYNTRYSNGGNDGWDN